MTVHCTLVGSPHSAQHRPPVELTIEGTVGTSGADLQERLSRQFAAGPVSVDGQDLRSTRLGFPPLVNGAVLVDGAGQASARKLRRRPPPSADAPLALAVHSGAGAGTVVPLRRGSYTIGRSNTRIIIPDPELSREHARLLVTESDIIITDLESANGTYVDGSRVRAAAVSTDSVIRCGSSHMSLVFMDLPGSILADAGRSTQEPLTVPGRMDSGNRAVLVLAAVLPLAIGVALAILTGMWMFLAFAAASALSVLVPLATGRRQRREQAKAVKAAVAADRERRQRSAPSLALLVLAYDEASSSSAGVPEGEDDTRVWLRLGEAPQPANVRIEPVTTAAEVAPTGPLPLCLDPGRSMTSFRGPSAVADGMLRSLVLQLAGYPRGRSTRIVIQGKADCLPLCARYLPQATLTASRDSCLNALAEGFGPGRRHGVLFLLARQDGPAEDIDVICEVARQSGWQVLYFVPPETPGQPADIELSERVSVFKQPSGDISFVPDLAPEGVIDDFCRRAATAPGQQVDAGPGVPDTCALEEILPLSSAHTAARWDRSMQTGGLPFTLGLCPAGRYSLDLQSDGPHLLVAGTTGSGKSELLRSLTLTLALSHPPDRVNFFFIDFKGGSGLGHLAGLVHCVGLLTDLSHDALDRTLLSLRAEVRLRECALAAASVPDLEAYRLSPASRKVALPHLVLVIDEFRILVDDAPEALRELMRIAAIGRSLGIHLVMATQRPQGALTADIRANVTSSIALRVQSDMESMDIINSRAAAAISLDLPGRAYLVRGAEQPVEFQATSSAAVGLRPEAALAVRSSVEYFTAPSPVEVAGTSGGALTPAEAAAPLLAMVQELWSGRNGQSPRLPVAPPLPNDLPLRRATAAARAASSACPGPQDPARTVGLGLMDLPEQQKVVPLNWRPGADSHLALIGGPTSGASEALDLAVALLLLGPQETHFYFLDAGGHFAHLRRHRRTGAHAGLHELRRGVRVLERLGQELARRLSQGGEDNTPVAVVISGWGSWLSAFRAGPLAWAEDLVQDLIRDGAQAGITVLISGDREVVTARFYGALPNRVYFPAGSNEDSRAAWPRIPAVPAVKGRAVALGPISGGGAVICQFYTMSHGGAGTGEDLPAAESHSRAAPAAARPFRVEPLPAQVTVAEVRRRASRHPAPPSKDPSPSGTMSASGTGPRDLLLGLAGDELDAEYFRLAGSTVFTVLGRPATGKTNVLRALQALNPDHLMWLYPGDGNDAVAFWNRVHAKASAGELPRESILLADDADLLPAAALRHLSELHALGHAVVLTANYSPLLLQRIPLAMESRTAGTGLLLAPRSVAEGDLFGVRFEVETNPPPGRGLLISAGRSVAVQAGWAGMP